MDYKEFELGEEREELAQIERQDVLETNYARDVRQIYNVAVKNTDASAICHQLLACLHNKRGSIDITGLRQLDANNRSAVLRLIDVLCVPSSISDGGLFDGMVLIDGKRESLLSKDQIVGLGLD